MCNGNLKSSGCHMVVCFAVMPKSEDNEWIYPFPLPQTLGL